MKRFLIVALVAVTVLAVIGTLQKLDEIEAQKALETPPAAVEGAEKEEVPIDIDFTRMNKTIQTSAAYRLMANPSQYVGKTIRMSGMFLTRVDKKDGKRYYGCEFMDPGCSCCAPGVMEFVPKEKYKWPTDFPDEESLVKVTGRLEMYEISVGQRTYTVPHLVDADVDKAR